jgi:hypothetical protein
MVYLSHSPPDGLPSEQQSSAGIAIPSKHTTSSSDTMMGCGCRCGGCSCSTCCSHRPVSIPDSNRETYGGQGTSVDILSNNSVNLNASSLEAQGPKNIIVAPPSLDLLGKLNEHTPGQLAEARTGQYLDEIDDAPWLYFISEQSMTSDASEMSGLFFGPIDLEGSMENNPVSSGNRSMLSSYASAMSVRSDAASAVVTHAGAALTASRSSASNQRNPFLMLT